MNYYKSNFDNIIWINVCLVYAFWNTRAYHILRVSFALSSSYFHIIIIFIPFHSFSLIQFILLFFFDPRCSWRLLRIINLICISKQIDLAFGELHARWLIRGRKHFLLLDSVGQGQLLLSLAICIEVVVISSRLCRSIVRVHQLFSLSILNSL